MVFELIKHIYHFFYPDERGDRNRLDQPLGVGDLIPCYDRLGNIIAYLPASVQTTRLSHALDAPHIATAPVTHLAGITANSTSDAPSLSRLMKHHSQELFYLSTGSKSTPHRRTRSASPFAARANQRRGPDQPHNSRRPTSGTGGEALTDDMWDPWPDGDFERLFTWEEVNGTNNLSEHWACQPGGGDKRGSESALTWQHGKRTRRVCLGVITCDEPTCEVVTRPQTRRAGIMAQLKAQCLCGGQLMHIDCGVTSVLYSFKGGVYYIHQGVHNHPKQTHVLHLSRDERKRFEHIVFENPDAGPAALIAGRHSRTGTRESVAKISTVLLNQDRVKAELQALRGKSTRNLLRDEEDIGALKRCSSPPTEECSAPVKRRRASQRLQPETQRGTKKRK